MQDMMWQAEHVGGVGCTYNLIFKFSQKLKVRHWTVLSVARII